ncbi:MAG TPA: ferritin-like domain-containing protein [Thermoanaerobaculia bacterium]|nr:ferritin-like domain-containing protein [Thermoanaerobaculia bacterium]
MPDLSIGSEEHKRLFCGFFVRSHDPFRPSDIVWPDLDDATLSRLKALPVWDEAARTEAATALRIGTLGRVEKDPLLAEAISLQGYEEQRHTEIIRLLAQRYGIVLSAQPAPEIPSDPVRAFLQTGYGECIDSFFAFGLFRIGVDSKFFPEGITSVFETIMQEEARHILFAVNWAAYSRAQRPLLLRPAFDVWRGWNVLAEVAGRLKGALRMARDGGRKDGPDSQAGFTVASAGSFGEFSVRRFLGLCLSENERRLAPYDARLLRPTLVPSLVRRVLGLLPGSREARPGRAPSSPAG